MNNIEMIRLLAKLQVLCMRYVERHTPLRCYTIRDMQRIITANKLTCTYGAAAENLYENMKKYCNNNVYLMENTLQLKENILDSKIQNLRFGIEPQLKFSEKEKNLDTELTRRQLYYTSNMVSIKDVVGIFNNVVTESAVKQACQQERLLNTKKIGKTWIVNIEECRAYWNITDTENSHLYNDWIY